ncbi:hypothetical protein [Chondromyces crocatus]|uniref:Uncharacterized protein n=1 Tax=Chondromyces crocatus TaxID=52 RepID=A0A0K1EE88_CHOCO|nr:hypothetical protein [Chondromyces crocatus]AKT39180.1 uncharacterized protein CMC5_033270 [Chondromyces crocatus]
MNVLVDIGKQRYGLTRDPCWAKYHQWTWDRFPLRLPACEIHCTQRDIETPDWGVITWDMEDGIPMVCRLDGPEGDVLVELLPRRNIGTEEARSRSIRSERLPRARLASAAGFGFEWVFEIPVKPVGDYQPAKALGIIRVDGERLLGKETTLTIIARLKLA